MSNQSKSNNKVTTPVKSRKFREGVIQDRILKILVAHPNGISLAELETSGQNEKKLPPNRYAGVGKAEFVTKDGRVYPEISERGFRTGIKYT